MQRPIKFEKIVMVMIKILSADIMMLKKQIECKSNGTCFHIILVPNDSSPASRGLVIFSSRHLYFHGEESIKGPPLVGYCNLSIVAKSTERLLLHFQVYLTYFCTCLQFVVVQVTSNTRICDLERGLRLTNHELAGYFVIVDVNVRGQGNIVLVPGDFGQRGACS